MKGEIAVRKKKYLCLRGNPWDNLDLTDLIAQMIFKRKKSHWFFYVAIGDSKQSFKANMFIFA